MGDAVMIRQIVYLDTYAVLNFFLDYFLLLGTGYATRAVLQRMRIVLSATIGAG